MEVIEIFKGFATDFELCVADDNWSRLAKWLAEDAIYLNVGGPDPRFEGRDVIINYLREDVMNLDRRFDSRTLEALTKPRVDGSNLNRRWRVTYTLSNAPDLVVEGEARYLIEGDLICRIEEEATPESLEAVGQWMTEYGERLGVATL